MNLNHPSRIVPQGAVGGLVQPMDFAIRYLLEYDVRFMQDRLRADLFIDGEPAGIYAVAVVEEDFVRYAYGSGGSAGQAVQELIARHGADLRRSVIEELVGNRYRRLTLDLQGQVALLEDVVKHIVRPRWWQFNRLRAYLVGFVR